MTVVVQAVFYLWLVLGPLLVVNLYPVRNSGIFLGVAVLTALLLVTTARVLRQPDLVPWRSRVTVPLLALAATSVVAGLQGALFYDSSVFGEHRYVLVQIYAVALILLSIGASFLVAVLVRSADQLRWVRGCLIVMTCLLLIEAQTALPIPLNRWWPLASTHVMAMVLAMVLFEEQAPGRRALGILFVLAVVSQVVLVPFLTQVNSQWLSGWIAISVPIGLLVLIRFPRISVGLAIPAVALGLVWKWDLVLRAYQLAHDEGDFVRLRLWEDAVHMTLQRPLFGIGPGNYLDYIMRYGQLGAIMSSPHGNYQQVASEMGLVGLGFLVWLGYRAVSLGWRLFRSSRDPFIRALSIGLAASLMGQFGAAFVGDFLLPSYHNGGSYNLTATVYSFVVIGLLMSLERLAPPPKPQPRTP